MTSLTEFLLARIAEDEEDARRESYGATIPIDCWPPDRIVAECEAKRRIVEAAWLADDHLEDEYGPNPSRSRDEREARYGAPDIAKLLAAIFADHPDYDGAWRP